MEQPRTREELIASELPDEMISLIITKLLERVALYGDVQAAKVLFEFRYGKSPEPPQEGTSLEALLLENPLTSKVLSSE